MDLAEAKDRVCREIDERADMLLATSHHIHDHPEMGYEEHEAHSVLTEILEREGLAPTRGAYGLDTAFEAVHGTGDGPTVVVCLEYDALPGIGHACGHNIIATAGLGAGLAAASVAEALGGRVVLLGTPAEEGGGGKIRLAEAGAFEGVDAAVMVHPADADLCHMSTLAVQQLRVEYQGLASHAAAAPWEGRNALDAAVLGYTNVAALRQHIRPEERVHGVFTDAGDRPNVVSRHAAAFWYVRAATLDTLEPLKARVLACLQAGADATGCGMEAAWQPRPYADVRDNAAMVAAYSANAERTGRTVLDPRLATAVYGSTDMGNVSYLVPSIHPMIQVAPLGVSIHTEAFAEHAARPEGDRAVLDGAKILAMTIVDLWAGDGVLAQAREEFARTMAAAGRGASGGSGGHGPGDGHAH